MSSDFVPNCILLAVLITLAITTSNADRATKILESAKISPTGSVTVHKGETFNITCQSACGENTFRMIFYWNSSLMSLHFHSEIFVYDKWNLVKELANEMKVYLETEQDSNDCDDENYEITEIQVETNLTGKFYFMCESRGVYDPNRQQHQVKIYSEITAVDVLEKDSDSVLSSNIRNSQSYDSSIDTTTISTSSSYSVLTNNNHSCVYTRATSSTTGTMSNTVSTMEHSSYTMAAVNQNTARSIPSDYEPETFSFFTAIIILLITLIILNAITLCFIVSICWRKKFKVLQGSNHNTTETSAIHNRVAADAFSNPGFNDNNNQSSMKPNDNSNGSVSAAGNDCENTEQKSAENIYSKLD